MIHEKIFLSENKETHLVTYIHDKSTRRNYQISPRPAIIVVPGGAFSMISDKETEPVALTFMKEGFHTFVLNYTVGDECQFPQILEEVSQAILIVRQHASEWDVDPNAIVLMGFSAGACVSAISATQWNNPDIALKLEVSSEELKPNAAVIGYGAWDNTNTIQKNPQFYNPEAANIARNCTPELDVINYVGQHVPPLFIWHNLYDQYVPAINPILIASKMLEYQLPFELHLFQGGEHGMSVCNDLSSYNEKGKQLLADNPNVAYWVPMCVNWLKKMFGI